MDIEILSAIYSALFLAGAVLVAMKKRISFLVSMAACILLSYHVFLDPSLKGMLIMAIGYTVINVAALCSKSWQKEPWI